MSEVPPSQGGTSMRRGKLSCGSAKELSQVSPVPAVVR